MGMSLNRAQLIGNLTRDPEVKQIPGGQTVATFGLATNFSWTDASGEKHDKTEFHNIVAWRKLAEICGQYLKKGGKVFIEGKIQTRDWEAEDGTKRYRTEIVADNMIMLDKKGGGDEGGDFEPPTRNAPVPSEAMDDTGSTDKKANASTEGDVSIDDLPF